MAKWSFWHSVKRLGQTPFLVSALNIVVISCYSSPLSASAATAAETADKTATITAIIITNNPPAKRINISISHLSLFQIINCICTQPKRL